MQKPYPIYDQNDRNHLKLEFKMATGKLQLVSSRETGAHVTVLHVPVKLRLTDFAFTTTGRPHIRLEYE